jgi:hypothetical protein
VSEREREIAISTLVHVLWACGVWAKKRGEMLGRILATVMFSINTREDERKPLW